LPALSRCKTFLMHSSRTFFLIIFFVGCLFPNAFAQLGGSSSFSFVNIDPTARMGALGTSTMSSIGRDVSMAYYNPSLHTTEMSNSVMLSYNNYLADINSGYFGFSKTFDSIGSFSGHIIFTDYGQFDETDVTGKKIGEFYAYDYVFQIGYGNVYKKDPRFTYGASIKFLYSDYDKYIATAFAVDCGATYHNPEKKFYASLLIRNLGYNAIPYNVERVDLPFDIQLGISKKLAHNPLRFTMVAHDLQQFNISYTNTNARNKNIDLETGQVIYADAGFGEKVMRHFNFGAELVFSDNFQLRGGYNHQRRKELAPENIKGAAGFSWGVGIGIKKFTVDYAMVVYFPGIQTNYFTVSKNLSDFRRAKPENF
jgi:hypothetical protein